MRRFIAVYAILHALLIACGGPASHPPEGPQTGYPCGYWGVECSNGACCPWAHICGGPDRAGFTRCPAGYCCKDGDPLYGAASDAGAVRAQPPR